MEELMLRINNVSKMYRLGQIGGTTLRDELQRLNARIHGREDPTKRIGAKDYNKGETFMALDGVSFDVKKGERMGIIGHNGAGKSTLLKLISRVTAPTGGSIGLNGRVASMLEVGTGFHGELTGRENIYMNGAILGMTKKEIDAKIEQIIDFSECRQFIDTPVKRYSSGMYVKLAFSVAAHLDSEIMIMDEVLAVGDMAFQKKCLEKMSDVSKAEGRTILYVSHNMNTIRQLCDRVVVLDHGKVVFDGGVEEGIGVYMNEGGTGFFTEYYLENAPRDDSKGSIRIRYVRIMSQTPLTVRDKLRFEIYWSVYDHTIKNVIIRALITTSNQAVGMCISKDIKCSESGECCGEIFLDTSTLAPGQYTIKLQIYQPNNMYESVDAMQIEIINDVNATRNYSWYKPWGTILLPQLQYVEKEVDTNVGLKH